MQSGFKLVILGVWNSVGRMLMCVCDVCIHDTVHFKLGALLDRSGSGV